MEDKTTDTKQTTTQDQLTNKLDRLDIDKKEKISDSINANFGSDEEQNVIQSNTKETNFSPFNTDEKETWLDKVINRSKKKYIQSES